MIFTGLYNTPRRRTSSGQIKPQRTHHRQAAVELRGRARSPTALLLQTVHLVNTYALSVLVLLPSPAVDLGVKPASRALPEDLPLLADKVVRNIIAKLSPLVTRILGQQINKVSLSSLRSKISLVSQDVILFDDSVENNIKYAKLDATDNEIKEACKLAAADEFIEKLPNKYKTLIGENAIRLSGGQKQRISIARAILKNSPIILLDEATSSLDAESEEKVQNAIFNLTKNRTTLVIAHRLSTINKANKIILMKEGQVLKSGTHNELLKNSPEYESLYRKQILH